MKVLQLTFFILKAVSHIIQETMYVKPQARSFAHSTPPEYMPIAHTQAYAHNTGPLHTLPAHTHGFLLQGTTAFPSSYFLST